MDLPLAGTQMALRENVSERAKARLGTTLKGKWTLDRILGVGGMATVYGATHRNASKVAIKMLHPEVALDEEVNTRFLREGYVANTIDHPGTVQVFDDDVTDDGAPFLVMEMLVGETLEGRWERKGEQLPASEVLPVVDQLLDVLAVAHARGIVHRDLKPENLFLTREGELKVLDFGIARLRELSRTSAATTKVGSLLGTPAFMAPEQALGRLDEVDQRTDLWAVGATLFTLLTGRFVHEAETVNEQLVQAATQDAPPLSQFLPEVPVPLMRLVDRALAFRKTDRWPDARAMQGGLREAQEALEMAGPLRLPVPSVARPPTSSRSSQVSVETVADSQPPPSSNVAVARSLLQPEETTQPTMVVTDQPSTTNRPITSTPPPAPVPQASRRRWLLPAVAAAFLLLGGGIAVAVSGGGETPDAPPLARSPAPKTVPAASTAPAEPTETTKVEPSQSAEEASQPEQSPKPVATAAAQKPTPAAQPKPTPKPVASPKPAPIKPAATAPPKPKPAPKPASNPFDRRH